MNPSRTIAALRALVLAILTALVPGRLTAQEAPREPGIGAVVEAIGSLQVSSWFAAAFVNSYDRFSVIAGIERAWLERRTRGLRYGVGYRAGLLTGYDEQLIEVAAKVPALPFAGLLAWLQVGRVGVDAFYVYRAVTLEGSIAF